MKLIDINTYYCFISFSKNDYLPNFDFCLMIIKSKKIYISYYGYTGDF